MFSCISVMVSGLIFKSLMYFELTFFFLPFFKVKLICNVVLVSGVQQSVDK